jgi:hypothetical protein
VTNEETLAERLYNRVFIPLLVFAVGFGSCRLGYDTGVSITLDEDTTRSENAKCALRGLVLLRGQLGEFVCVVPGSERGRRKP